MIINKNSQQSQQTKPLAVYHTKIFESCKNTHELKVRVVPDSDLKPLNTNRQSLAAFVFCFKIHALLLLNSRAAVLKAAFFAHGNCCQLFQTKAPFPIFFSAKLEIYCCRQADVNNIILSVRLEEFQLFKVLRSTIDNQRDSGLHSVITLSRKRRIQLFATLGDELFCHDGR